MKEKFVSERRKIRGFTLVEAMIAVAITMVLSTMLLTYNRSSEKQIVLFRDQAVLVGFLNRAKALAVEKFNKEPRVCAFGLYFPPDSPREFILFQDLQPEGSEPVFGCRDEEGNVNTNLRYDAGEKLESFKIDERLNFVDVPSELNILFVPPELSVISSAALPVEIKIGVSGGANFALVIVGEVGQITAQ